MQTRNRDFQAMAAIGISTKRAASALVDSRGTLRRAQIGGCSSRPDYIHGFNPDILALRQATGIQSVDTHVAHGGSISDLQEIEPAGLLVHVAPAEAK